MNVRASAPLNGKMILITRSREDAQGPADAVKALGGTPIICPAIRIVHEPAARLMPKLRALGPVDWIFFTSRHAVDSLSGWLKADNPACRLAAIGEKTAAAIESLGLTVDLTAAQSTGDGFLRAVLPHLKPDAHILLPQSQIASATLPDGLKEKGLNVSMIKTYRTLPGAADDARPLISMMKRNMPDAVLFASPSAVRGLATMLGTDFFEELMIQGMIFSIGPKTTRAIRDAGFQPASEAAPHNMEGLMQAMTRHFQGGAA